VFVHPGKRNTLGDGGAGLMAASGRPWTTRGTTPKDGRPNRIRRGRADAHLDHHGADQTDSDLTLVFPIEQLFGGLNLTKFVDDLAES